MNPAELFRQETDTLQLAPGEFLFREGEKADRMYVLLEGEIDIFFGRMRIVAQYLLFAAITATGCGQQSLTPADFAAQRQRMVEQQLKPRGIKDERVLAAMAKVPREEFVPADERGDAYEDGPLPIGFDQTISQPYIVAFMTEQLRLKPSDRLLEIGSGSGYQAAVLAELVADVYNIEILEPLAKTAEATLQRLGYKNVHR